MSNLWDQIEPHIDGHVRRTYDDRPALSQLDRQDALKRYEDELEHFARLINADAKIELYFMDGQSVADAPVQVDVESNRVSLGLQCGFFLDDIPRSAQANRLLVAMIVLSRLAQRVDREILRFRLGLLDGAYGCDVGFCSRDDRVILIPDTEFLSTGGYASFRRDVERFWKPWNARMSVVMWRGSTTGILRPSGSYKSSTEWYKILPRVEICARLKNEPYRGHANVGISSVVQLKDPETIERIQRELKREYVARSAQIDYRYMLDIDGNTNAWAGLAQGLLLGGCIIKVESEHRFRQWYYDRLHAGQNILSVRADLTDLEDVVEHSLSRPVECLSIATEGRRLFDTIGFDEAVEEAVMKLIAAFTCERTAPIDLEQGSRDSRWDTASEAS